MIPFVNLANPLPTTPGTGLTAGQEAALTTATRRQPVSSIAALKALTPSAGDAVNVLGYYASGDGGGGTFYYDSASSATDNGGTVIAPTAGEGRWKRVYSDAVNVRWFGAKGDGAVDDTASIQAAITSISNTASNGRAGGSAIQFPDGDYKITSSLLIDGRNINIIGNKARILYAGSGPAIDVGNAGYLTNLSAGYYVFRAEKIAFVLTHAAGIGIRNRGYRRLQIDQCHFTGGLVGIETEGAWSGSLIRDSVLQGQSGSGSRGVNLKQRNNLFLFQKVAVLGGEIGYHISTVDAETKGVTFQNCDAEGCVVGYQIDGGNVGAVSLVNCWGENNTTMDVQINNTTGTGKYGISLLGGVYAKGVTIGVDGQSGALDAVTVSGVEFSGGLGLDVRVANGVAVGANRFGGTAALTFPSGQGYGGEYSPSAETMLRYSSPTVPGTSGQGGGAIGDIRWAANRMFVCTGDVNPFWQTAQLEKFSGTSDFLPNLENSNTPSVLGVGKASAVYNQSPSITDFTGGFTGQQITIIGTSAGTTTIVHGANIRLPGGGNITLAENDSITLVCRRASPSLWVCTSYVNNA